MVREHYAKLGFEPEPSDGEETRWRLRTDVELAADVMRVARPAETLEAAE